jgi:hypothetical protein
MNKISRTRRLLRAACRAGVSLLALCCGPPATAYSVLTHEAIVDSTWDSAIKPLLLNRFPASTEDELVNAHAYAYGGSIIQDLGYYPFGSKFYSDLTHYVRSGDFIASMIRESQDLDEYAFALGPLSHYAADNNGHRMATNLAVPLLYPQLQLRFGNSVTYADDPYSHTKTEFGFDVFQAAKSRYASEAYKGFVGFQVAKGVLQRAFEDTYGMRLEQVFLNVDLAIGSYRRAVGTVLPALTKVAWQLKKQEIRRDAPASLARSSFTTSPAPASRRVGAQLTASRMLTTVFHIVPRVGPFKAMAFKPLTPQTEKLTWPRSTLRSSGIALCWPGSTPGNSFSRTTISIWVRPLWPASTSSPMRRTPSSCTNSIATIRKCRKHSGPTFSRSIAISACRSPLSRMRAIGSLFRPS